VPDIHAGECEQQWGSALGDEEQAEEGDWAAEPTPSA
jgi:hypothetical protein